MNEYEKENHMPQQRENLLNARVNRDLGQFENILGGMEIFMQDNHIFMDGLQNDRDTLEKNEQELSKECREGVLKALENKNDEEFVGHLRMIMKSLDDAYNALLGEYMDEAMRTAFTYDSVSDTPTVAPPATPPAPRKKLESIKDL